MRNEKNHFPSTNKHKKKKYKQTKEIKMKKASLEDTLPGLLFSWNSGNKLGVDNLAERGEASILLKGIGGGPTLKEEFDAGKFAEGLSCPDICLTKKLSVYKSYYKARALSCWLLKNFPSLKFKGIQSQTDNSDFRPNHTKQ